MMYYGLTLMAALCLVMDETRVCVQLGEDEIVPSMQVHRVPLRKVAAYLNCQVVGMTTRNGEMVIYIAPLQGYRRDA